MFDQKTFNETLLESMKSLVNSNVIIGEPIVSGNVSIIPVFKASIGIVEGGVSPDFGSGAGGISVTPVTFIAIENGTVRILSAGDTSMVERLVEAAPGLINKISSMLSSEEEQTEKTPPAAEQNG
ncbi:MAG: hypothetical protein LBC27_07390 [Spirochaetaceae bacterium]|jgi:uncharacterized spore protein YtfJ|nr:hypothetical protein [Spirochaetaceae bacterium]